MFDEPDIGNITHLFLVGGFAESTLLQVIILHGAFVAPSKVHSFILSNNDPNLQTDKGYFRSISGQFFVIK